MRAKTLSSIALALLAGVAGAAPVTPEAAQRAATRWVARNAVFAAETTPRQVASVKALTLGEAAVTLYHVALAPRGYLVMAGDDRLPPVLAFSATTDLDLGHVGQNALRALLVRDGAAAARGLAAKQVAGAVAAFRAEWAPLLAEETQVRALAAPDGEPAVLASTILKAPMIQTQWSQWKHFNKQFPTDPAPGNGYDGKAPVGCMAVAGAQLTAHYNWPPYGNTGHVNTDANAANLISGTYAASSMAPIDWSVMQNQYNPWASEPEASVGAVSRLMYAIGVLLNVDFGSFTAGGSSASVQSLSRTLNRAFFFERGSPLSRSWNPTVFDSILRSEILAGRPTVCSIPGHSVIVDGLSTDAGVDYYHMNYGLGGVDDGWYRTSATPDGGIDIANFYQWPTLIPLLNQAGVVTNTSGHLSLNWVVPAARQWQVNRYRVREGTFAATNIADTAASLDRWTDYAGAWTLEATGYADNSSIRKVAEIGDFALTLRDVCIPTAATRLTFNYKAILDADSVHVEASTDRGQTWTTLHSLTQTGYDTQWKSASINLAAYAGRETLVRFLYRFKSGSYYGSNGGLWLDNVALNGVQQMRWTVLNDQVPAGTQTYAVGTRLSGTHHFEVQVHNGTGWSAAAPFVSIAVELDPALDVDADGLANGWELAHFGSVTGGVASLDTDGDGASNGAEFTAGTDPLAAASVLAAATATGDANSATGLSWPSVAGKRYAVWRAPALNAPFVCVASDVLATPPVNTWVDDTTLEAAFYRLSVE